MSKIDYDKIVIERVSVFPPIFNGDVIFELPKVDQGGTPSNARQMVGMDKSHDGYVSKTVTTNIINAHGLLFRTSNCIRHLRCMNRSCKYLNYVHRTNPLNLFVEYAKNHRIVFLVVRQGCITSLETQMSLAYLFI